MNSFKCFVCGFAQEHGSLLPDGWYGGPDGNGSLLCPTCVSEQAWVGVDWDGTLVEYHGWEGPTTFGAPIAAMVDRVRGWLARGQLVKVMTARAVDPLAVEAIRKECARLFGAALPVTDRKDYLMLELWDDRAVRVVKNTGEVVGGDQA